MKRTIFYIGLLLPLIGVGQDLNFPNLILSNSSCGYYDGVNTNPIQSGIINLTGTTSLAVGTAGDYSFKAEKSVHIGTSTHVSLLAGATGKFQASIGNQLLDAVIMSPANPNAVPEFSKLEIGIHIPSLDTKVADFISNKYNVKPGTQGYTDYFNQGQIINPYDPQQISVDAVFYRPGSPNTNGLVRHGFYIKDVTDNAGGTDWANQGVPSAREWRVRFAPDVTGTWTGYINVYIGNQLMVENKSISFTVVAPVNNEGFVQKGPNPLYLQYSGTGNTYIPVGCNYSTTMMQDLNNCYTKNCDDFRDHRIKHSAKDELDNFLSQLAPYGNSTRLLMCPWGFDVEFEKLCNYDSRQIEMSVLDYYVDQLEQKNVKLILGQIVGEWNSEQVDSVNNPDWVYHERWLGNPYNNGISMSPYRNYQYKGINGINKPEDIFDPTSLGYATALQFTKNKWRYIESRWGYSTAISEYELVTEVDGIGYPANSYWAGNTDANVANFFNEIGRYLKENMQSKHLITASFSGDSYKASNLNGDHASAFWSKPNIDIISGHNYVSTEDGDRYTFDNTAGVRNSYPGKLVHCNEFDNHAYAKIPLCSDIGAHNRMWSSMFSGVMGPGLPYGELIFSLKYNSTNDPASTDPSVDFVAHKRYRPSQTSPGAGKVLGPYNGEYYKNYASLLTFVKNQMDLKTTNYTYSKSLQPSASPYYETFMMVSSNQQKAYGWVHNRSFYVLNNTPCLCNYLTGNASGATAPNGPAVTGYSNMSEMRDFPYPAEWSYKADGTVQDQYYIKHLTPQSSTGMFPNKDNYVDIGPSHIPVFGSGYNSVSLDRTQILIGGLAAYTYYDVSWYWTWGSNGGASNSAYDVFGVQSDGSGNLNVWAPPTGTVNGTAYPGDWAVRIKRTGTKPTGIHEVQHSQIMASPNPSNGIFSLTGTNGALHEKAVVRLYDVRGRLLMDKTVQDLEGYQLDLGEDLSGIYILKVTIGQEESILRLVKNKE